MSRKHLWGVLALLLVLSMVLTACGGQLRPRPLQPAAEPTAAPAAAEPTKRAGSSDSRAEGRAGLQIPDVVEGKFNVACVLIGPHDDGGWSQAHYDGLDLRREEHARTRTSPTSRTCPKAPRPSRSSAAWRARAST